METRISRMQVVQSPIIPAIADLIRTCPGTISLGQGVVYYDPPPEAMALLPKFLADPKSKSKIEDIAILNHL